MPDVHRLLVTGSDRALIRFNIQVQNVLNGVEKRGQTVLFACMDLHLKWALEIAQEAGVEVKEIVIINGMELHPVLLEASPWGSIDGELSRYEGGTT